MNNMMSSMMAAVPGALTCTPPSGEITTAVVRLGTVTLSDNPGMSPEGLADEIVTEPVDQIVNAP